MCLCFGVFSSLLLKSQLDRSGFDILTSVGNKTVVNPSPCIDGLHFANWTNLGSGVNELYAIFFLHGLAKYKDRYNDNDNDMMK